MVNVELITRRRVALGLSRHDLARASGLSWQALFKLEESSWTDGLDPADLLKRERHQATEEPDAKTVGAALAANPDGLQDDVLARALDWPADRVQDAIATLAQQLPTIGQTVRHVHGHTQLVPANLTLDTRRLDALARATRPLGHDHARILLKTLRGTRRENRWENFTAADRGRLIDLIDQDAIYPTAQLRRALTIGYNRLDRDFPSDSRFRPNSLDEPPVLGGDPLTRR